MKDQSRYRFTEIMIFSVLWAFVFTVPVMLSFNRGQFNVPRVQHELIRILPFFLLFYIHHYFLFRLFHQGKKVLYILFNTLAIIAVVIVASNLDFIFRLLELPVPHHPPGPEQQNMIARYFYNFLISILVVGLNLAIRITFHWMLSQKKYEQLQKENYRTELELLRHQVSPHFFMNTLNNIHALIDFDSEKAKSSIVKLSKLMRVLLRNGEKNEYYLKDEITFLKDYIDLMRIRMTDDVEVQVVFPENTPDVKIPPLLFISLLENAFKHGIKESGKSFIHLNMEIRNNQLSTHILNSKGSTTTSGTDDFHIGLENSEKRFDLIYGNNHTFSVNETDALFEVQIIIPLI
jgi:hypothetical protein